MPVRLLPNQRPLQDECSHKKPLDCVHHGLIGPDDSTDMARQGLVRQFVPGGYSRD